MSPLSFPHLSPTVVCNSFHTAGYRCIELQGGKFSVYLIHSFACWKADRKYRYHLTTQCRPPDFSYLDRQLNNIIFWDPSKNSLSPCSPLTALSHWCAFTSPQFSCESTQTHIGQVQWLLPRLPSAPSTWSQLPSSFRGSSARACPAQAAYKGAASSCPIAQFVWYCYPNRDAALCTESGVNSVSFTHTPANFQPYLCSLSVYGKEAWRRISETLEFWPLSRQRFTKHHVVDTAFPCYVFSLQCNLDTTSSEWRM